MEEESRIGVFFWINKPSSSKIEVCNAFVNAIDGNAQLNMPLYYCDEDLFDDVKNTHTVPAMIIS